MDGEQLGLEDLERELGELGNDEEEEEEEEEDSGSAKARAKIGAGTAAVCKRARTSASAAAVVVAGVGDGEEEQEQEAEEEEEEEEEDDEEEEEYVEEEEAQSSQSRLSSQRRPTAASAPHKQQQKQGAAIAGLEPSVSDIWARTKQQPRKRQRPRTGKTAGRVLPDEIATVLGQATNAYIMRDHQKAAEMFTEVVRQAPQHPDAYQTLAVIHQEKEQPATALELFYIAAKLTKNDARLWGKVADLAFELDDVDKALEASRHAVRLEPSPQTWLQLAHAYLNKKSVRQAHDQITNMLAAFPTASAGLIEYGEHCFACGKKEEAEWAFRVFVLSQMAGVDTPSLLVDSKTPNLVRMLPSEPAAVFSAVSTLLDLYLEGSDKDAEKGVALVDMCLDLIQQLRSSPSLDGSHAQEQQALTLPLDVATKYGLCHLKLGHTLPAIRALQPLHATNIDESDDALQMLELKHLASMQYFAKGMNTQAAKLLQSIFDSQTFAQLPVERQTRLRLEFSEIQEKLGNVDAALQSVLAALDLSPNYAPALRNFARLVRTSRPDMQLHAANSLYMHLLVLAQLVNQQQASDAALSIQEAQVEIQLAVEWAMACKRVGDETAKQNFVAAAEPLVDAWLTQACQNSDDHKAQVHSIPLSSLRALGSYTHSPDYLWLTDSQNTIRKLLAALAGSLKLHTFISADDMFQLLLDLLQILLQLNRESQAAALAQRSTALTVRPFTEAQQDQLRALCHHLLGGTSDLRTVTFNAFIASPTSIPLANAVSRMLRAPDSTNAQPLQVSSAIPVAKLLKQAPESLPLNILFAHSCVTRHFHAEAITKYFDGFLLDPKQPLTCLSIAAMLLNLSAHPSITDKRTMVLEAFAMLSQYTSLRLSTELSCSLSATQREQEALYNIGRAFHQIELLHLAEHYYRASLEVWDRRRKRRQHQEHEQDQDEDQEEELDVAHSVTLEAAHNLVQIYRKSDARELALEVMAKYLTFGAAHA